MRVLLITIVLLVVSACTPAAEVTTAPPPAAAPAAVTRSACQVPLTPDLKKATAGASISNDEGDDLLAVSPAGEALATVDDELRLIQPDGTSTTIFSDPDPDPKLRLTVAAAAINERWIVLGLNDNSTRVVDRRDGSARTVAALSEAGYSFVLRDDNLYWTTSPHPESDEGTLHSFDLQTSVGADVDSGAMFDLRATATGVTWQPDFYRGPRVFHSVEPIPPALASVPGIDVDPVTLVRDGDAYAWITGVAEGGTGVARWAPDTGLTRITTARLFGEMPYALPPVYLAGPFIALGRMDGSKDYSQDVLSILVDTRSGALLSLQNEIIGGGGGMLATRSGTIEAGNLDDPFAIGLLSADAIPPMSCTSPQDAATTRPSCEMTLPASWRKTLTDGEIRTGGKTIPLASGPDGVVAVSHDEGETHELLLVGPDHSVRSVYRVANPDRERVDFAALDERWIVVSIVGVDELRGSYPTRIDVVDRMDDSIRTVVQRTPDAERRLDSVALFRGTVYWISREPDRAIVQSQDLDSNAVADVAEGQTFSLLRATPVGVAWNSGTDAQVVHEVAELPAPLVAAGVRPDDETLVSDGIAYAWVTDTGVEHWAPDTGVTQVRVEQPWYGFEYPFHVAGPYVILRRPVHQIGRATVVDTRTGGVVSLDDRIVASGGGSLAMSARPDLETYSSPSTAGLVRIADLPPLTC